jgi:enoyl-CoA hydratase/carnithine racemase
MTDTITDTAAISDSILSYQTRDRIARITLRRPTAKNAINPALDRRLKETWSRFESDPEADVAILTGEGDAFCAGADLREFLPTWLDRDAWQIRRNADAGLGGITRGQHRITKPIIGAINGWALAGGFELALACDIRIAADTAKFGSYEIRRGFHHGDGGIVRLVAMVGVARAMDYVLTGRDILADEALRVGIVSEVVPAAQLLATAERYAARIASYPQIAVRSAKETILEVVGRQLDDALRLEAIYGYSSAGDPDEVRRRLAAFFSAPAEPAT